MRRTKFKPECSKRSYKKTNKTKRNQSRKKVGWKKIYSLLLTSNGKMLESILQSETFPYALAVWQSRVRIVQRNAFAITAQELGVVSRIKSILETTLDTPIYLGRVECNKKAAKLKYRLVLWSKPLMDLLYKETRGNTAIPRFAKESVGKRRNYIRGFLERGCVTYSPHNVRRFDDYRIKYPRITLTKVRGGELLGSLANLLRAEGISPSFTENFLGINKQSDIRKIIKKELVMGSKLDELKELHVTLREYQEIS